MIKDNSKQVADKYRKYAHVIAANLNTYILKLCALQIMFIKDRTNKGVDLDENPFRPNSGKYAAKKQEVVGHVKPNILSGSMLNSMITEMVNNTTAKIVLSNNMASGTSLIYDRMGSQMISNKEKANKTNVYNPWFGFGGRGLFSDERRLNNALQIMIMKDINNV